MKKTTPRVKREDLLAHFAGSVQKIADHFDIDRAAVYQWGEYIPELRAHQVKNDFPHLVEKETKAA